MVVLHTVPEHVNACHDVFDEFFRKFDFLNEKFEEINFYSDLDSVFDYD